MSFREKLIGAWKLAVWTSPNKDNHDDVIYPFGKDAQGMIIYTPDGYMSAHLDRSGSPSYSHNPLEGTAEERAQVALDTMAYSGLYYLEEAEGDGPHHLYHHVKVSQPRNWVETIQSRPARILEEGGEVFLLLEGPIVVDDKGVARFQSLKWRRAKNNSHGKKPSGT